MVHMCIYNYNLSENSAFLQVASILSICAKKRLLKYIFSTDYSVMVV